ncbi:MULTISPECIES: hypothetical protein [Streptomyces]|uniref:hypothetical protein n=1 Tax=Streptomyces TaxID=1883 RepID=UPI00215B106A|nr:MULTISPECIES: hypothetical protein [Streptomyces]WFB87970.1 hypothetical protein MMU79_34260 [Streptomyces olivaceus]WGK47573.1 hypothetical protein M6G09_19370 [Streptomyces sp. B146]
MATEFAVEIDTMLSQTVARHVQVRALAMQHRQERTFLVASNVQKNPMKSQRFELDTPPGRPNLWMEVSFQLRFDEEREYLAVQQSFVGVFKDKESKEGLFHYDYERRKGDGYPDAHLQVYGSSTTWEEVLPGRPLPKLHFPMGGTRFRPCVEDIVEFLIVEGIVNPRPGWKELLNTSRDKFQANQLKAAMRRNPQLVEDFVRRHGESLGIKIAY